MDGAGLAGDADRAGAGVTCAMRWRARGHSVGLFRLGSRLSWLEWTASITFFFVTPRALIAFSEADAQALTGLSQRQLRYWDETGVYSPHARRHRLYSFVDIVALRTLAKLRDQVSLETLRAAGKQLTARYERPWNRLRFVASAGVLHFVDPETGLLEGTPIGQIGMGEVFDIQVKDVASETEKKVIEFRRRRPEDVGQVERRRGVQSNATCIKGTRVTTKSIAELARAGIRRDEILTQYPELERADVDAAIAHEQEVGRKKRTA